MEIRAAAVKAGACTRAPCPEKEGSPVQRGSTCQTTAFCSFVCQELFFFFLLLLICKKELFVLAVTLINYVMTLLLSQGLALFPHECLPLPVKRMWRWVITVTEHSQKEWHEEAKDTDSQDHGILKLEDHLFRTLPFYRKGV